MLFLYSAFSNNLELSIMIKNTSGFKDQELDHQWFHQWVERLTAHTGNVYQLQFADTSLGKTAVYTLAGIDFNKPPLVIFPGYRTSSLFWDLQGGLDILSRKYRLYLVETNGQPNLSDGNSPDITTNDYGWWAQEVLNALNLDTCFIAGASFGGQICMKLGIVAPQRIQAAFLLNPAGLRTFSLNYQNVFFNLLPILSPKDNHIGQFIEHVILHPPEHQLNEQAFQLLAEHVFWAITRHIDRNQKPYYMGRELTEVQIPIHLILGENDVLFRCNQAVKNAKKYLPNLQSVSILKGMGHGIETDASTAEVIVESF